MQNLSAGSSGEKFEVQAFVAMTIIMQETKGQKKRGYFILF